MDHGHIVAMGTSDEIIISTARGKGWRSGGVRSWLIHPGQHLAQVTFINGEISIQLDQKTDALTALESAEQSRMDWRHTAPGETAWTRVRQAGERISGRAWGAQAEIAEVRADSGVMCNDHEKGYGRLKVYSRGYLRTGSGCSSDWCSRSS